MKKTNYFQRLIFLFLCILILCSITFSQTAKELTESNKLERQAINHYRAKNYEQFLKDIVKADVLRPNHARLIYISAIAYSLNNKPEKALNALQRLADMGLFFQIEKDKDLKTLQQKDKFKKILAKFKLNSQPVNKSEKVFELNQKDLITESVAFDKKTKAYFVSSVHQGKILKIDEKRNVREFSTKEDELWSVLGIKIDEKRRLLYACTTAFPQYINFKKSDEGKSGIFKYNLDTGKLIKKYILSENDKKFVIGDLAIHKNGDVYATDSVSPHIYKIDTKTDSLEIFLKSENFSSLQGITFNKNYSELFVADYSKGIFKISLSNKTYKQLKPASNITILGIDGLYFYKNKLIAIQNGTRPNRVVELALDDSQSKIISFKALEANHSDFEDPTLGTIVNNQFYYVANSQWNFFGRDGKLQRDKLKNPVILKLRL